MSASHRLVRSGQIRKWPISTLQY